MLQLWSRIQPKIFKDHVHSNSVNLFGQNQIMKSSYMYLQIKWFGEIFATNCNSSHLYFFKSFIDHSWRWKRFQMWRLWKIIFSFSSPESTHQIIHECQKDFKCDYSGKSLSHSHHLRVHIKTIHKSEKYVSLIQILLLSSIYYLTDKGRWW